MFCHVLITLIFEIYRNKRDQEFKDRLSYMENFRQTWAALLQNKNNKKGMICSSYILFSHFSFTHWWHFTCRLEIPILICVNKSQRILWEQGELFSDHRDSLDLWQSIVNRRGEQVVEIYVFMCVLWKHWNLLEDWMYRKAKRKEAGVG